MFFPLCSSNHSHSSLILLEFQYPNGSIQTNHQCLATRIVIKSYFQLSVRVIRPVTLSVLNFFANPLHSDADRRCSSMITQCISIANCKGPVGIPTVQFIFNLFEPYQEVLSNNNFMNNNDQFFKLQLEYVLLRSLKHTVKESDSKMSNNIFILVSFILQLSFGSVILHFETGIYVCT